MRPPLLPPPPPPNTVRHPLAAACGCPRCGRRQCRWSGPRQATGGRRVSARPPRQRRRRAARWWRHVAAAAAERRRRRPSRPSWHDAPPRRGADRHTHAPQTAQRRRVEVTEPRAGRPRGGGRPSGGGRSGSALRCTIGSGCSGLVYRITVKHSPSPIPKRGHKTEGGATMGAQCQ